VRTNPELRRGGYCRGEVLTGERTGLNGLVADSRGGIRGSRIRGGRQDPTVGSSHEHREAIGAPAERPSNQNAQDAK